MNMQNHPKTLWVGAFSKTNAIVVYDPELQIDEPDIVNLFSVTANQIRSFDKSTARSKIRKATKDEFSAAVDAYYAWEKEHKKRFLSDALIAKAQASEQRSRQFQSGVNISQHGKEADKSSDRNQSKIEVNDTDYEFELNESKREVGEFIEDLSRSEDDGWFYSDSDPE